MRLVDGPKPNEGRVEILHDGHWGTICDDNWDANDADVVCRALNYSGAVSAPKLAAYEQGNGHVWLDNVDCIGNESSIDQCKSNDWGENNCIHAEDAGVFCQDNVSASYGNYISALICYENRDHFMGSARVRYFRM